MSAAIRIKPHDTNLTKTNGTAVRFYGNSSSKTSPMTYFFDPRASYRDAKDDFERVVTHLAALAETRDSNGAEVIQFMAMRRAPHVHFVAYRFTSDWAHDKFYRELLKDGGALGRGSYDPWVTRSQDYDTYLAN